MTVIVENMPFMVRDGGKYQHSYLTGRKQRIHKRVCYFLLTGMKNPGIIEKPQEQGQQ